MVKKYFIRAVLFLLPVVMILGALEFWTRSVSSSPKTIAAYLDKESQNIEVMVLGASQNQAAIHPGFISKPTINLASGHQDYAEDFHLLNQLKERLPKLNTVLLPMTFAHLDTPPNKGEYWKHATLLNYYNVNAYGRTVYAKDRLLYLSNPSFYSQELLDDISPMNTKNFGAFGYMENALNTAFEKANYDKEIIENIPLSINNLEDTVAVKQNTASFKRILAFCTAQDLDVYIVLTPITPKYYAHRNPAIVARRDAFLKEMKQAFPKMHIVDAEKSTYLLSDFKNHNHLNPEGAKKFTKAVSTLLETGD